LNTYFVTQLNKQNTYILKQFMLHISKEGEILQKWQTFEHVLSTLKKDNQNDCTN